MTSSLLVISNAVCKVSAAATSSGFREKNLSSSMKTMSRYHGNTTITKESG